MVTPLNITQQLTDILEAAEEARAAVEAKATTPSLPPSNNALTFSGGHATNLPKKTILISGGTAGIGLALVRIFAQNNFNVATFSSTDEKVRRAQAEFAAYPNVLIKKIDVRNEVDLAQFVTEVEQRFEPIQFLINNAAIPGPFLPNEEVFAKDSQMTFDVNFHGLMNLTRIAQNSMRIAHIKNSVIINLSSLAATGIAGAGSYSSSKAAVNIFSATLAKERPFSSHFVFAFDPGPVDTNMQAEIRTIDPNKFRFGAIARKLYSDGKLANPSKTAEQLYFLITHPGLFSAANGTLLSHTTVQEKMENPGRKRSASIF